MGLLSKIFGRDRLEMQDVKNDDNETCETRTPSEKCMTKTDSEQSIKEKTSPFLAEDHKE